MNYHRFWLNIVKKIIDLVSIKHIVCPRCKKSTLDFQYVGDVNTRIGYLDVWCNSCLHGIHVSRVLAPDKFDIIPFEQQEEISSRIPSYTHDAP